MDKLFSVPNSGRLLGTALALGALAIAACSGSPGMSLIQSGPQAAEPAVSYTFQPVDDTKGTDTQVTGINDDEQIVGVYTSSSGGIRSFTATGPSYTSFTPLPYPAKSTVMNSITVANTSEKAEEAGWLVSPHGLAKPGDTFGAIDDAGIWFVFKHDSEGLHCLHTWLYGINKWGVASGYTINGTGTSASCVWRAFLLLPGGSTLTDKVGPSPSAEQSPIVTGIDNAGDVVGTANVTVNTGQGQVQQWGWYQLCKTAYSSKKAGCPSSSASTGSNYGQLEYVTPPPGYQQVSLTGINVHHIAVGTVGSGSGSYGFVAAVSNSGYTVDATVTEGTIFTVLNGINDNGYICGWYEDNSLYGTKGFVGTPLTIRGKQRPH